MAADGPLPVMRLSTTRKWLLALYLSAAVSLVPGSFASFAATATNEVTFASGSMVLADKLNGETKCLSSTGGVTDDNANEGCTALFTLTDQDPGGSNNRKVRLENEGTVDASSLTVAWTGPDPCTTVDALTTSYHGTGDLCGDLRFYIQEFADEATWDANDRTGGTCWYGDVTVPTDCAFQNNRDLAHFSATYPTSSPLELTGGLAAGQIRYFRVYLSFRGGAGNTMQGREVDFGITWTLEQ